MHRPGYGIASIKAANEQLSSTQQRGNKLAQQELVSLSEQLFTLKGKLEAFTRSPQLMSQIQSNAETAAKFYAICNRLGISTVPTGRQCSINEVAVQVCEVFIQAKQAGGGFISKNQLRSKVHAHSEEHLNKAMKLLEPLGFVCKFHGSASAGGGEDVMIQIQDMSAVGGDSMKLMQELRSAGLSVVQLVERLAWKRERVERALVSGDLAGFCEYLFVGSVDWRWNCVDR